MTEDTEHTLFMKELIDFLCEARRQTYVIEHGDKLPDGTEQMVWQQQEWSYVDRYVVANPYGGQELVWNTGQVAWMMNYYAEVVSDAIPMKDIYRFQRRVLSQPDPEYLMRGPKEQVNGKFCYRNDVEGELSDFSGNEQILHNDIEVYRMRFHGGVILH